MSNLAAFIEGIDSLEPLSITVSDIDDAALRSLSIICIRELGDCLNVLDSGRIADFVSSISSTLCDLVTRYKGTLVRIGQSENARSAVVGDEWSQLSFLINTVLRNADATGPLSPSLRFSLCVLRNDVFSAAELVQEAMQALNTDMASALSSASKQTSADSNNAARELQQIMTLLDHARCAAAGPPVVATPTISSNGLGDRIRIHMLQQLRVFISHYRALVPLIAVAVRSAVLHDALFTNQRYEVVSAVLSEAISTSSLDALYTHLSSLRDVPGEAHHSGGSSSSAGTGTGRAAMSSVGVQQPSTSADGMDQDELASAPGYEYHRHISREEAIKVLYPLPEGSFLLRPHETVVEQLYLSFRTGHAGRVTSGKDAVVKHAIIRRTSPEGVGPSVSIVRGSGSGDGGAVPVSSARSMTSASGEAELAEGCASPLPPALRSPLPSSGALPIDADEEGCAYVCGKLGPCSSLLGLLKEISSVLENPLRFAPIEKIQAVVDLTPHSPVRAGYHSISADRITASSSGSAKELRTDVTAPVLQSLDLNVALWKHLGGGLPARSGSSQGGLGGDVAALPDDTDTWRVADRPGFMAAKDRKLVQMLALCEYLRQLGPAVDVCNALASMDCAEKDTSHGSAHERVKDEAPTRHLYQQFAGDAAAGTMGTQPFTRMFSQLYQYVRESEAELQAFLLPTSPLHAWCAPRTEYVVRGSAPSPRGGDSSPLSSSGARASVFAPGGELLVAEHLLHLLSGSAGTKNVRLTSTSGTEHVVLPRCMPAEEVHRLLEAWRDMYIQHESQVTQRLAARRLAERANRANKADTAAGALTAGEDSGRVDPRTDYETAIVSHSTSTTDTTLSAAAYCTLKRVDALLHVDITCGAKDYLHRVIAWLSDELQLIYEITRPGDYAFSAAQRFYCPRHPWEVRVLRDFTQAGERVKLGRNTYTSASPDDGALSASTDQLSSCRSEYFTRCVAPALMRSTQGPSAAAAEGAGSGSDAVSAAGAEEAFWALWSSLGAEQYLHSVMSGILPSALRDETPALFPVSPTGATLVASTTATKPERSSHSAYTATLEHYLHRNVLNARVGLLQRTVPLVQLDVYGIQEILAVRTISTSLHAPVAIPSGVSPMTYMSMFNKPTVLAPTTTTHAAAALDIYAVMQLAHRSGAHTVTAPAALTTSHKGSTASSGTNSPAVKKAGGPLTAKNCPIGSVVTSVHKAEARRTPLEQSDNTASACAAGGSGSTVNNLVPNTWYTQQQQGITRAVEYNWRDQALFRFPLPEGQYSTTCPAAMTPTLHGAHGADACTGTTSSTSASATSAAAAFPPTALPIPSQYFEPPNTLVIAVYERTFFSDTLLGELELDLAPLNGKKMIRGWYPLVLDRAISWLVFVQVRLKLQDLYLEPPGAQARNSAALAMADGVVNSSASGSAREGSGAAGKAGAGMSANIIKQMDDFY